MMKKLESLKHPWLMTPVFDIFQALEPRVTSLRILRKRRHNEFESRFAIGIHEPAALFFQD